MYFQHFMHASVQISYMLDKDNSVLVAVIGFDPITYDVTEGVDQSVNLNVRLISGVLGRDVGVFLNTQSGTATS